MSGRTTIEWTESTWNPVTGCDRISHGCDNCYAERLAARLHAMGNPRYKNVFKLTVHEDLFEVPLRWREPRVIFVNSMSDLFHEAIPRDAVKRDLQDHERGELAYFPGTHEETVRALETRRGAGRGAGISGSERPWNPTATSIALKRCGRSRLRQVHFLRAAAFSDSDGDLP